MLLRQQFPKLIYSQQKSNQTVFLFYLVEIDKQILKRIYKYKYPNRNKAIFIKENKVGGLTPSDSRLNIKHQ